MEGKKRPNTLFCRFCLLLSLITTTPCWAMNKVGRLGLGYNRQLINNMPALSMKVQKSRSMALGAMMAVENDSDATRYGVGAKAYRILFEESHLTFYTSVLAALLKDEINNQSKNGYQVDLNLGSEFHIPGLESIGFSFEFGFSLNKLQDNTSITTTGYNFMLAGIHFYL